MPRDTYRQRVYLEPLGLFLQAVCCVFTSVEVRVTFAAAARSPAGYTHRQ